MPSSASSRVVSPYDALADARPESDAQILFPYVAKDVKEKRKNTDALRAEAGFAELAPKIRRPLLVAVGDADTALLPVIVPAFGSLDADLLILGDIAAPDGLANVRVLPFGDAVFHRALAGADILLFAAPPARKHAAHLAALRYAAVPVIDRASSLHGDADEFDVMHETGNAFLYDAGDIWSFHAAIVRAVLTYRLPVDWRTVQKNGLDDQWL